MNNIWRGLKFTFFLFCMITMSIGDWLACCIDDAWDLANEDFD